MDKEQAIEIIETHSENILSDSLVGRALDMAIDALKAQLSQEDTTFDTISRQAAIDIFDDYNIAVENGELEAYSRDRKRLCNLPTIQPQSTAGQLNDSAQSTNLIDRQETIDRFNVIRPVDPKKDEYTKGIDVGIAMRIVAVKDQPTVQPEPKEGHWIEGGIYRDVIECYCSECGQIMTTAATVRMNYCPNCGAHMKGERQK